MLKDGPWGWRSGGAVGERFMFGSGASFTPLT
jgi:hypothetical protein